MSSDYQHANKILSRSGNTLWLGDCQAAQNLDFLLKNGIKTGIKCNHLVITMAIGFDLKYPSIIKHHVYPLQDIKTENMLDHFEDIVIRIDKGIVCLNQD